ncbi:hypothetical protein AVEN_37676-1 [Araneus ventricosus]|uniref:Uncharacterized protein n=1 Tax=Araneus ventricosus TaxID=182803 RepID=A0A4Y2NNJ2_ARAVE|nr:hypothetical protein AVEN_37676-1 [Araneus ventricosus]
MGLFSDLQITSNWTHHKYVDEKHPDQLTGSYFHSGVELPPFQWQDISPAVGVRQWPVMALRTPTSVPVWIS